MKRCNIALSGLQTEAKTGSRFLLKSMGCDFLIGSGDQVYQVKRTYHCIYDVLAGKSCDLPFV